MLHLNDLTLPMLFSSFKIQDGPEFPIFAKNFLPLWVQDRRCMIVKLSNKTVVMTTSRVLWSCSFYCSVCLLFITTGLLSFVRLVESQRIFFSHHCRYYILTQIPDYSRSHPTSPRPALNRHTPSTACQFWPRTESLSCDTSRWSIERCHTLSSSRYG